MAPKKDKKKEEDANKAAAFTEVEKEFLVLQIADLNRKVARLRTAVDEYEVRNDELQKAYDQLDEDRADIIAYLKKTLNVKTEENYELKDKIMGLEETRDIETAQFKETVTELEKNFISMKDHLTSENKLLAGKLNTLEEFRAVRDDLMRKFETQEQEFKNQEEKYKKIIYEAEKKFTTDKDKLKKEMEARLLQLAQDFQDATELRIAASTHRVIRENIAINNELDNMLSTQAKLSQLNEKFKDNERVARAAMELAEEERDKAINKNLVQLKVIDKLTTAFQELKKKSVHNEQATFDFEALQAKIQKMTKENEELLLRVRVLEENLHTSKTDQDKFFMEATKVAEQNRNLKEILKEAAVAVRATLKLDQKFPIEPQEDPMDRQVLLSSLLDIVTQYREICTGPANTVPSLDKVYKEGDLGFIPKPRAKRSATSAVSLESLRQTDKSDCSPFKALSSLSLESVKIIQDQELVATGSVSFATSAKSSDTLSPNEGKECGTSEVGKQFFASKLETHSPVTKSGSLTDTLKSKLKLSEEQEATKSKPVKIIDTIEGVTMKSREKVENTDIVEENIHLDEQKKIKERKEVSTIEESELMENKSQESENDDEKKVVGIEE